MPKNVLSSCCSFAWCALFIALAINWWTCKKGSGARVMRHETKKKRRKNSMAIEVVVILFRYWVCGLTKVINTRPPTGNVHMSYWYKCPLEQILEWNTQSNKECWQQHTHTDTPMEYLIRRYTYLPLKAIKNSISQRFKISDERIGPIR